MRSTARRDSRNSRPGGLSIVLRTIVVEPDLARIHQDFADAAQTKQIAASLLAAFNTREPLNRVLTKIVDESPFLRGRIDETSKSLSKNSPAVFLLNQVRGMVKELLFHDYALSEASIPARSAQVIGTTEAQDAFVERTQAMLTTLTEHMASWNSIVAPPTSGGPANQVVDFRKNYINMSPMRSKRTRTQHGATKIDWRRNAEIWQGNIITRDKITTVRGPGRVTAKRVMEVLGIKSPEPTLPLLEESPAGALSQ
ncbi:hypothetical protein GCM10022224_072440 [Nonomuraea antimicrobica]|uniref:Uncharacterized protein n=1 Tax=Nonomuraea antimicrobica TaxID=561173 RepID=A0ABP7CTZ3_9ACTN